MDRKSFLFLAISFVFFRDSFSKHCIFDNIKSVQIKSDDESCDHAWKWFIESLDKKEKWAVESNNYS